MNGAARVRFSSGSKAADMLQECTDEELGAVHPIAKLLCGEDEICGFLEFDAISPFAVIVTQNL
jgi:hypothetical protein